MRISIVAIGTRGDVQPLVALGLGLRAEGFDVQVVTHVNFRTLVESFGLRYLPVSLDMEKVLHTNEGKEWLTAGRNILKTITQMTKLWKLHFDSMLPEIRDGCADADAILFSYLGMGACHVGERYKIPCIGCWPTPVSVMPSRAMSISIPVNWAYVLQGGVSWVAHHLTEQMVWQTFGRAQNKWRANLGLPSIHFPGIIHHFRKQKIPFLYGFSPQIVYRPANWPSNLQISGFWILENSLKWDPPEELVNFIQGGSAPFYIGFGSMVTMAPQKLGEIAMGALDLLNARGIIATGWTGLKAEELNKTLPKNVFAVDYAPHNWLFPKMKGMVHHGGASTTGAALLSGKPSTVVPFFADQAFWGDKLERFGVAAKSIPFKKLNAMRLAEALNDMQSSEKMNLAAQKLSVKIAVEDGVANAVASIVEFLKA